MANVCTPEEMVKRIAGIKAGCEEGIRKGLVKACAIAETQAKKNLTPGSTPYKFAPFDTGLLRGHIGYSIDVSSVDQWTARVGVEANVRNEDGILVDVYGLYVHDGTRPHYAPPDAIKRWAERKNKGKGTNINWYFAWKKIAEEGTEPKPFVTDAIAATRDQYMPVIEHEYQKPLMQYCARYG